MSRLRYAELAWLVVAAGAGFGAHQGGDASIACGWIFLGLTFPFWLLWQTQGATLISGLSLSARDLVGVLSSIALTLLFWWHVLPYLLASSKFESRSG